MRNLEVRDLGLIPFGDAFALQQEYVSRRKQALIPDQLLYVSHPHVITMGRNGHRENLLASEDLLSRAGVEFHHTDRGGDVTYHGPGQVIAYPIFDLREWKRDVVAYVRALEQVVIDTLAEFDIHGIRCEGCTGVWVQGAKVCAIGVHLSRWVTSHGLALNVSTNLDYFRYIVPCGLTKPVTSMNLLGSHASTALVAERMTSHFARIFQYDSVAHPLTDLLETTA